MPVMNWATTGAEIGWILRDGVTGAENEQIEWRFRVGDAISCVTTAGIELARGLTAYASDEVERIKGLGTGKIAAVLGYSNGNEVIHRDDLVVLDRQDRG